MALSDLLDRAWIGERPADAVDDFPELAADGFDPVEPDPKPSRSSRAAPKEPPPKVTAAVKKEVRDKLGMLINVPAAIWAQRDPFCAGVFNQQADEIVDRLTAIAVRNRRMLAWLTSTGEYTDWIMLLSALAPLFSAIWSHHVARTVSEEGMGHGSAGDHAPGGWDGIDVGAVPFQQPSYRPYAV